MKKHAGKYFNLEEDKEILSIDSPRKNVLGPWFVVYKNIQDRWAVVFLHYDLKPCLGIRWFYGNLGTPSSRSFATWFIVPNSLNAAILEKLPIENAIKTRVYNLLANDSKNIIAELSEERKANII